LSVAAPARAQDDGALEVGAGVRGRLADAPAGGAFQLDGRQVQLEGNASGGAWARRRWGLKPVRRHEGQAVQLHLHSPDGEEVCAPARRQCQACGRFLRHVH